MLCEEFEILSVAICAMNKVVTISDSEAVIFADLAGLFQKRANRRIPAHFGSEGDSKIAVGGNVVFESGPYEGFHAHVTSVEGECVDAVLLPRDIHGQRADLKPLESRAIHPKLPDGVVRPYCTFPLGSLVETVDEEIGTVIDHKIERDQLVLHSQSNELRTVMQSQILAR
jgi:hypothetical protein